MDTQQKVAVRIHQLRKDTVIHFRGGDLQKGSGAVFCAHLEPPCRSEPKRGWGDKILDMQAGGRQPVPIKGKPFSVRVEDAVQQLQPLPSIQHFCQSTHGFEMVQGIQNNPGEFGPGAVNVVRLQSEDQELGFHQTVVSLLQLTAEHLGIQLPQIVKIVTLGSNLNALHKILPVHVVAR